MWSQWEKEAIKISSDPQVHLQGTDMGIDLDRRPTV